MIRHVFSLVAIVALGWTTWHYQQKSKTLAAQREENGRNKQTILLQKAEIESVRNYAFTLYLELQETGKEGARFRFLFRFFEKESSVLASRVDALTAARLAAEKKELGARLVEFLFGWFFGGGRCGPSYG